LAVDFGAMSQNYAKMTEAQRHARVVRQRERRAEKKAAGHCRDCKARKMFKGGRCKPCYTKALKATLPFLKARREDLIKRGLCTWCGKRKARPKVKTCKKCSDKYKKR
jgi:hypothetical protein